MWAAATSEKLCSLIAEALGLTDSCEGSVIEWLRLGRHKGIWLGHSH